jgi:hypothetical protein
VGVAGTLIGGVLGGVIGSNLARGHGQYAGLEGDAYDEGEYYDDGCYGDEQALHALSFGPRFFMRGAVSF